MFCNCTCFSEELMEEMAKVAGEMREGAFLVTLTKALPGDDFVIVDMSVHELGWGKVTIFIHRR